MHQPTLPESQWLIREHVCLTTQLHVSGGFPGHCLRRVLGSFHPFVKTPFLSSVVAHLSVLHSQVCGQKRQHSHATAMTLWQSWRSFSTHSAALTSSMQGARGSGKGSLFVCSEGPTQVCWTHGVVSTTINNRDAMKSKKWYFSLC